MVPRPISAELQDLTVGAMLCGVGLYLLTKNMEEASGENLWAPWGKKIPHLESWVDLLNGSELLMGQ